MWPLSASYYILHKTVYSADRQCLSKAAWLFEYMHQSFILVLLHGCYQLLTAVIVWLGTIP